MQIAHTDVVNKYAIYQHLNIYMSLVYYTSLIEDNGIKTRILKTIRICIQPVISDSY